MPALDLGSISNRDASDQRVSLLCLGMRAKLLQSCPTLCDPMDCSPPGSSVHGILQTRILEWVTMPASKGSSPPRDGTRISHLFCLSFLILKMRIVMVTGLLDGRIKD